MFKWPMLAAATLAIALQPAEVEAQDEIETVFAIPAQTLTFSAHFVAHDAGFFKKEGLKVTDRYLVGVASPNAVLAGSADFTMGTGPVFLRAAAQGQKFKAIANLVDKPLVELVLRKDVADAAGITAATPVADRAKAMMGRTIAIDGVGSIVHAWQRYVTNRGGLDVEKDVRIAPMSPPSMLAALTSKAVDGYTTSMPYTTEAIVKGQAIMLASSTFDAPELLPFAYALVYSRPDFCKEKRDLCARVARAYIGAAKMIQEKPDEVYEKVLKQRFAKMDPELLAAAWKVARTAHAKDIRVTVPQLENSQKVSLEAKLLDPKDALKSYDDLFTNEFLR
ncbi:MAG: ABC transporter substrate-binding protein [Hyphomicrobiaceae bacterium]|nr:ABC transporter substrate-binding protein [Hyphomicrobiaceae bacterium]